MINKIFVFAILVLIGTSGLAQSEPETYSKTTLLVGSHWSIPFADITLARGDRKTVTHDLSSSIGFLASFQYQIKKNRYLFLSVDYSSFNYTSTEQFFNQMEFTASDDIVNFHIQAGFGWLFSAGKNGTINLQGGIGYMFHNQTLENFPSERTLPSDLSTVNITMIDWDLFNRPAMALGLGYNIRINENLALSLHDLMVLSIIEGDIVDTPTSNDFDTKPNMSRAYFINNIGVAIGYSF